MKQPICEIRWTNYLLFTYLHEAYVIISMATGHRKTFRVGGDQRFGLIEGNKKRRKIYLGGGEQIKANLCEPEKKNNKRRKEK